MKSSDRVKAEEQYFALDMICNIIVMYEQATRGRRGRETGVMTRAGMDVFEALSFQRGAFVRPVPLDREDLMERCQLNGRRIDQAVRRLIAEGFVTLSGLPDQPMVQLHIPTRAFETFQRIVNGPGGGSARTPLERDELDCALAWLDDPSFEKYAEWEPILSEDRWLGRADRPESEDQLQNCELTA
jgi:hypothetical protein